MPPDLTAAAFDWLVSAPRLQAVSFDVFDTALVRSFARPADLFSELGCILADRQFITVTPDRFSHLRIQAEALARRRRADREPRLTEIYQELAPRLDWSDGIRLAAETLELELERAAMSAVPRVRGWILAARAAGRRIAFVSDMYLPASAIRTMLTDHGLALPGDTVLVSCESRVTKADGGLFDELTAALALPAPAILHVGDNPHSDGIVPRARGFPTVAVQETQLGFFERRFLAYQHDTAGLSGRLAATARLARLAGAPSTPVPAMNEIGTGLLGPWLGCFALWTFERARRAGVTRLYFVSRDGQVMRAIAQAVQQRCPEYVGIECRYLHGSRLAWHHAAMTALGDHQLAWLLNPQPKVNAVILANRLGLSTGQLGTLLGPTEAAGLLGHAAWGPAEIAAVDRSLRQESAGILALPIITVRRELAQRYLAQEGLLHDSQWAVVELGWSGSMMVSLHEALGRPPDLKAYYLNLGRLAPDLPPAVRLESFAIHPDDVSTRFGEGVRFAEMIEVLTAADHGTVLGYEELSGKIVPCLKTDSPAIWPAADLDALRRGAQEFVARLPADVLPQLITQLAEPGSARLLVHQLVLALTDFMRAPPPDLARAFTACRFTEDPTDRDPRRFVRPLGFWAVLRHGWPVERELWAQGSLACTPARTVALVHGGVLAAGAHLWRGLRHRLTHRPATVS